MNEIPVHPGTFRKNCTFESNVPGDIVFHSRPGDHWFRNVPESGNHPEAADGHILGAGRIVWCVENYADIEPLPDDHEDVRAALEARCVSVEVTGKAITVSVADPLAYAKAFFGGVPFAGRNWWEVTAEEFVRGFRAWDAMSVVLAGTRYEKRYDYSNMSPGQGEAMAFIERESAAYDNLRSACFEEVRREFSVMHPEQDGLAWYGHVQVSLDTHKLVAQSACRQGRVMPERVVERYPYLAALQRAGLPLERTTPIPGDSTRLQWEQFPDAARALIARHGESIADLRQRMGRCRSPHSPKLAEYQRKIEQLERFIAEATENTRMVRTLLKRCAHDDARYPLLGASGALTRPTVAA